MMSLSIRGDACLDNREDLRRELDAPVAASDLDLVLVAYRRWGASSPAHLLGDFAFLIEDTESGAAFGARDHAGAAPFCYRVARDRVVFGASAREAADDVPSIDETRIADVLVPELEGIDATSTLYAEVRRLPAAHTLTFAGGAVRLSRYWDPRDATPAAPADDAGCVEAFRAAFREAVRCRLRGAAASMLSGGLDSSAIVGFGAAIRLEEGASPLPTISAVTADPACEETRHARAVATMPGIAPSWVEPGAVVARRSDLERFLALTEPFDASMILPALVYASARDRGATTVLDGLDGDVVASLEPTFLADLLRMGALRAAGREAAAIARFYGSSALALLAGSALRAFTPPAVTSALGPARHRGRVRNALRDSLIHPDLARRADVAERLRATWSHRRLARPGDPRARHLLEVSHPQIPAALERYHRVASSQGVRPRHPFLDRRLVELCASLPWSQLVRDGWTKSIVRRASAGALPDPVRWRRGRWVRLGPLFLASAIASFECTLADEMSAAIAELDGIVDPARLREAWDRHRRGDAGAAERVWQAFHLASWLRRQRKERYDPAREPVEESADDGFEGTSEDAA